MQISTQLIPNSENLLKNILLDNIELWLKGFKVNEKTKNKLRVSKSALKVPILLLHTSANFKDGISCSEVSELQRITVLT